VAVHLVKLACERPDQLGRSLAPWAGLELAHHLERAGVVAHIAPETVRRILKHHRLKPWRPHGPACAFEQKPTVLNAAQSSDALCGDQDKHGQHILYLFGEFSRLANCLPTWLT
jgi:hypothetical protein